MITYNRIWAMPNSNTLSIKPIREFTMRYLSKSKVSVDPFARDCGLANYTNDLDPETKAQYHLTAEDFLAELEKQGVKPDLVIFDPPYNLSQLKQCYKDIGREFSQYEAQYGSRWIKERDIIKSIQPVGGIVLTYGWSTTGMGINRGYEIIEILLVPHGGAHNDTICIAEAKVQGGIFDNQ